MYPHSRPTPPRHPALVFIGLALIGVSTVGLFGIFIDILVTHAVPGQYIEYCIAAYLFGFSFVNFGK